MASKIFIPTPKIWDYYYDNRFRLWKEEDMVAKNDDTGIVLTVSGEGRFPELTLYNKHDVDFEWRQVTTREECNAAAVYMITHYILDEVKAEKTDEKKQEKPAENKSNKVDSKPDEDGGQKNRPTSTLSDDDIVDLIYEREDELRLATVDYLITVLNEKDEDSIKEEFGAEFIPTVLDDFLQYLRDKHEVSVYRPTIVTDEESGLEVLEEYPYGWPDTD